MKMPLPSTILPTNLPFHLPAPSTPSILPSSTSINLHKNNLYLMRRICTRLLFPWQTRATAEYLYHHFCSMYSLPLPKPHSEITMAHVMLACIFFAGKFEDTFKKSKEVIINGWDLVPNGQVLTLEDVQVSNQILCAKRAFLIHLKMNDSRRKGSELGAISS